MRTVPRDQLADVTIAKSYEKVDENRQVSRMFKSGCEVTNEPAEVIAARLRTLANDERIWRMPAKFQWTMLKAAWLLERKS